MANVAGLKKQRIQLSQGASWWNTQLKIRINEREPGITRTAYGVYVVGGALACLHYSARYKAGEPLPWWASYMKESTEWLIINLNNLSNF